ncbi:MAG: phosphoenolpyruvate--protein phosphotransferase, partial [Leptospiraceae bacterium]|nr:phosphoenolpyruvate--protein phosphotransferase [Leptospiraceae bacterium]
MNTTVRVLEGIPAAPGMALGRAFILRTPLETVPRYSIAPSALPGELERFRRAIQTSREQMESLLTGVELDDELRAIFEAQLMVLEDPLLIDQTRERISDRQINAEQALAVEINSISEFLLKSKEAIFRERVADLEDIGNRLLSNLMDVPGGDIRAEQIRKLPPDAILVADDISPSLMLHIRFVGGIAVESGGVTGHMAILSRSRGIPCVVGVRDLLNTVSDGMDILLDAENGRLCLQPGEAERRQYAGYLKTRRREATRTITSPVNTACGQSIALWTNLSDVDETTDDRIQGASGVGLFRTEFLYLKNRKLFNDYTGQKNIYGQIFQNLHGQTVTFRLLDVGGDKRLPASANVHQRQLRGIRFLLANRWLLESQLRAIYEAALDAEIGDGICRLMVPMVSTVEEMEAVRHSFD